MSERLYSPHDIVRSKVCIGCGSCVALSNDESTKMAFDTRGELKPAGSKRWYRTKTEAFSKTCPFSPRADNEDELANEKFTALPKDEHLGYYTSNYVGHVAEEEFRLQGSSGGMVTWLASELIRKGLVDGVAHVVAVNDPENQGRFFKYQIARTDEELRAGAKSRYYPIEMSEIMKTIREVPGRYAVVGIPCFIKAVHLLRRQDPVLKERIQFTLGLFCGHMKSARFVESIAWQMRVPVEEIRAVEYRQKFTNRPANLYNAKLTLKDGSSKDRDWWHLVDGDWGAGFFMNNACNYCDDVVAETADVAFGDAWVEPYSSDGRGTNVVIARSALIDGLIKNAISEGRLSLTDVDADFVKNTQAAGFRQRREGLAYRLTWSKTGVKPCKRVAPDSKTLTRRRKAIYRMRNFITAGSHRMFNLARKLRSPLLYLVWARTVAAIYHGFAYHSGKVGEIVKRYRQLRG
jgi:coenzyme F420-reducing hydrogenase beta subunit